MKQENEQKTEQKTQEEKIKDIKYIQKDEDKPFFERVDNNLIYSLTNEGKGSSKTNYLVFRSCFIDLKFTDWVGIKPFQYIDGLLKDYGIVKTKSISKRLKRYLKKVEDDGITHKALKGQRFRTDLNFIYRTAISKNLNEIKGHSTAISGLTLNGINKDVVRGLNFKVKNPQII